MDESPRANASGVLWRARQRASEQDCDEWRCGPSGESRLSSRRNGRADTGSKPASAIAREELPVRFATDGLAVRITRLPSFARRLSVDGLHGGGQHEQRGGNNGGDGGDVHRARYESGHDVGPPAFAPVFPSPRRFRAHVLRVQAPDGAANMATVRAIIGRIDGAHGPRRTRRIARAKRSAQKRRARRVAAAGASPLGGRRRYFVVVFVP